MRASIPRSNTFLATDALTLTPIFNPRRPQTLRPWRALTFSHFERLIKSMAGRSLVMTGHLDVPGLTSEGRPVSLDPVAMKFLREDVGFDGVAIPDELAEMGSITDRGIPVAEAIEQSIVAGNDMALFFGGPADLAAVLDHLEGAVEAGRLSPARVDDSIRRVVTLKSSGACSA